MVMMAELVGKMDSTGVGAGNQVGVDNPDTVYRCMSLNLKSDGEIFQRTLIAKEQ